MSQNRSTIQYTGMNISKDEFVKQLGLFTQIIQHCPDNMIFRVNIEADPIDQRFEKIAGIVLKANQETKEIKEEEILSAEDLKRVEEGLQIFKDRKNEDKT